VTTLTYNDYLSAVDKDPAYYNGRWPLYEAAAKLAGEIKPESCLELGAGRLTIINGADVMDSSEKTKWGAPDNFRGKTIIHNAEISPWPISDKQYDLFIALQVFEHLHENQRKAFEEAKRISKNIIVSLPYKWDIPKNKLMYPSHHMIDEKTVAKWTEGIFPSCESKVIIVPSSGEKISLGEKIIFMWKNISY
jgi:hypothetical protein